MSSVCQISSVSQASRRMHNRVYVTIVMPHSSQLQSTSIFPSFSILTTAQIANIIYLNAGLYSYLLMKSQVSRMRTPRVTDTRSIKGFLKLFWVMDVSHHIISHQKIHYMLYESHLHKHKSKCLIKDRWLLWTGPQQKQIIAFNEDILWLPVCFSLEDF